MDNTKKNELMNEGDHRQAHCSKFVMINTKKMIVPRNYFCVCINYKIIKSYAKCVKNREEENGD